MPKVDEMTPQVLAGLELKRLRTLRKWSQQEVADRMAICGYATWRQSTVGRIEGAKRPLGVNEAVSLATLFDVPVMQLIAPDVEQLEAFRTQTEKAPAPAVPMVAPGGRLAILLTVEEAAAELHIARRRVYELINGGELPSVKIGKSRRIRSADLAEYVASLTPASDGLHTIPGVAGQLGCSDMHIYRLIAGGELHAVDISAPGSKRTKTRVRDSDLADFIERRTRTSVSG